jgi:hypothetical protein
MLVKDSLITVGMHIEFQGLQLYDLLIGDIFDVDGPKIGLSGSGTNCGEFRAFDIDIILPTRILIGDSL